MSDESIDISALVHSYRRLVLWFGGRLVLGFGSSTLGAIFSSDPDFSLAVLGLFGLLILTTTIALAIYAYRTASALGSTVGLLWAIVMIVPCVNLICLLILSSRATQACRSAGVPVGFFGPKI